MGKRAGFQILFPSLGRSTAAKFTRSKEPTPSSNQPFIRVRRRIVNQDWAFAPSVRWRIRLALSSR